MILNALILVSTTLILFWALFLFGATETQDLYRLFIALTIPVTLTLWKTIRRGPVDRASLGMLAVGGFLLLNILFRGSLGNRGFIHLWVAWAAYFIYRQTVHDDPKALRMAVTSLLLIGGLEGVYALLQVTMGFHFQIHPNWMPGIANGTLYNRNHFAGMMNMLFPLSMSVLLGIYRRGLRKSMDRAELLSQLWLFSVLCGVIGLTVLLSRSRAGISSLCMALVFITLYLRVGKGFRRLGAWKLALPVVISVVILGSMFGFDLLLERFGTVEQGIGERIQIYRDTAEMIWDHPWLGVGPGMYVWRFRPYQSVGGRTWYDYAHDDYLQTAAEWGIPLALLFWAWVGWKLVRAMRIASRASGSWEGGIALGCATGALTLVTHSFVDFNLYIPTSAMIFLALLALPAGAVIKPPNPERILEVVK